MSTDNLKTIGRIMYCKDLPTKTHDVFPADSCENQSQDETDIHPEFKDDIHKLVPLGVEMSSVGIFLMNGVGIRLRFDFRSSNLLINAADPTGYKYMIQTARLWTQKNLPSPDAIFSLNRSLIIMFLDV